MLEPVQAANTADSIGVVLVRSNHVDDDLAKLDHCLEAHQVVHTVSCVGFKFVIVKRKSVLFQYSVGGQEGYCYFQY
jgi:hypothetical protein